MNEELTERSKKQIRKENLKFLAFVIITIVAIYFVTVELIARYMFLNGYEYDESILEEKLANVEINKDEDTYLLTHYRLKDKKNNIQKEYKYISHTDLFNYEVEVIAKNNDNITITKEVRKGNILYIYDENNKLIDRKIFFSSFLFLPSDDNMSVANSDIAYPKHEHFVIYNKARLSHYKKTKLSHYKSINGLVKEKVRRVRTNLPISHVAEIEYDYPLLDEGIYEPVIYKQIQFYNGVFNDVHIGHIFYTLVKKVEKKDNKIIMKTETRRTAPDDRDTYKRYGKAEYVYEKKSSLLNK